MSSASWYLPTGLGAQLAEPTLVSWAIVVVGEGGGEGGGGGGVVVGLGGGGGGGGVEDGDVDVLEGDVGDVVGPVART